MQDFYRNLEDLDWVETSHIGVKKKVFFKSQSFESNITQLAYSELSQGIEVPFHFHETMEEIFFVIDGQCQFNIQGKLIIAKKNSTIKIPVNKKHSLLAITNCKFFYFGISI
jgi:quercetin dioxygenase-like cupin family protein